VLNQRTLHVSMPWSCENIRSLGIDQHQRRLPHPRAAVLFELQFRELLKLGRRCATPHRGISFPRRRRFVAKETLVECLMLMYSEMFSRKKQSKGPFKPQV
jgi:hypothetical protein